MTTSYAQPNKIGLTSFYRSFYLKEKLRENHKTLLITQPCGEIRNFSNNSAILYQVTLGHFIPWKSL